MKFRSVSRVLPTVEVLEGEGFLARRPFPVGDIHQLDPFIQLDEFGPASPGPGEAKGAPDHPHRGIETVTYILEGEIVHRDDSGYSATTGPGCVQWLTAGDGVIHSEFPSEPILTQGGRVHGFQLWINLPSRFKRVEPRIQEFCGNDLPVVHDEESGLHIRVIAGSCLGVTGPVITWTPLLFTHLTLEGNCELDLPVTSDWQCVFYAFRGTGKAGTWKVSRGELVQWNHNGELIRLKAGEEGLEGLLFAGEMLSEPFLRHGPFVMNHPGEIYEAIRDYRNGCFGKGRPVANGQPMVPNPANYR